ncbi:GNAT family N-acetyltransferase [Roseateles chitinivorans]|nr:GNAT family N-acetyltransferase [Roseateles chitinivorans]
MGDVTNMLQPPQLLTTAHVRGEFSCGHVVLDAWLQQRAQPNQASGASRTYVVATARGVVIGYYSIAPTALEARLANGSLRRNAPTPIPMYLLGRLAVDASWNGRGIGAALLQDARARAEEASRIAGGKGLLCHAIDHRAKAFYTRQGFAPSPMEPLMLMLALSPPTVRRLPPSA